MKAYLGLSALLFIPVPESVSDHRVAVFNSA